MRKYWKKWDWKDVLIGVLIVKILYLLGRCFRNPKKPRVPDYGDADYIFNQLVVLKKEGVSREAFDFWVSRRFKGTDIRLKSVCGNCDDTLFLFGGNDVPNFVSGEKVATGGSSSGSSQVEGGGEDDIAFYSFNINFRIPEPKPTDCGRDEERFDQPDTGYASNEPPLTVAVFDTGLLPEFKKMYSRPVQQSCKTQGESGWNFVHDTSDTSDDHDLLHGSVVTKLICDQAETIRNRRINILPVKTHDSTGRGDLFSILCGVAYAAGCGASIINASFGFYARRKASAPDIMTLFLRKYLVSRNILLIAAAGNADELEDHLFEQQAGGDPRNLEEHAFFPASLSRECPHVITVTTVSVNRPVSVSPTQNFSDDLVNIGVNCDLIENGHFSFQHPFKPHTAIYGSSYAAPIVAGIISQYFSTLAHQMPGSGAFRNDRVVAELKKLHTAFTERRLQSVVQHGSYCNKTRPPETRR